MAHGGTAASEGRDIELDRTYTQAELEALANSGGSSDDSSDGRGRPLHRSDDDDDDDDDDGVDYEEDFDSDDADEDEDEDDGGGDGGDGDSGVTGNGGQRPSHLAAVVAREHMKRFDSAPFRTHKVPVEEIVRAGADGTHGGDSGQQGSDEGGDGEGAVASKHSPQPRRRKGAHHAAPARVTPQVR